MANKRRQEELLAKRRFWKAHIQAWEKSGLSQNDYCRRNKLKVKSFWYWKKKFTSKTAAGAVNFVPVPVPSEKSQKISGSDFSGLTLFLNNIEIQVSNDFNTTTLTRVVDALERRS
ncbi:MAG: hypothetical protein KQH63_17195 [Desulfobulbaceae bacterium]|nr:hypothetical protein [Desulfobulbaceae bacterium]